MDCRNCADRLIGFIEGELSPDIAKQVEDHLADCPQCREQHEELQATFHALDQLPKPSDDLSERFQGALDAYIKGESDMNSTGRLGNVKTLFFPKAIRTGAAIAAAAAIAFFLGLKTGERPPQPSQQDTERLAAIESQLSELKDLTALSLLANASPSDRILGAEQLANAPLNSPIVLDTLFQKALLDPSINVRYAAIETLQSYSPDEVVFERLLQLLKFPNSSLIQAELIKFFAKIEDPRALPVLQKIASDPNENETIRQLAEWAAAKIDALPNAAPNDTI